MPGHIIVVGSLNMDLVVRAPRHPQVGETILGNDFRMIPGGKGANQAVAAARLGAQVKMVGRVGADAFGEVLVERLRQDRVDTRFIKKDSEKPSGVALIVVSEAGDNSIVVASGANGQLSMADVTEAEEVFEGASVLLLQLESPLPAVKRAIELARLHNVQVVLNPAPAQEVDTRFLTSVDYLIPNEAELARLAGVNDTPAAIGCLRDLGIGHLIVTLGGEGAFIVEGHRVAYLPAFQVDVVDTTAAGDAFIGAFGVALSEGLSTRQAATWGNVAGALAATRIGAQPSLPARMEFENFLTTVKASK